jgi:hypothetical protein
MKAKFSDGGFRIPPMGGNRNLIKSAVANEVVAALNALGNMQVLMVEGLTEPSVIYSGGNVVLQIPKIDSTAGGSITVEEEDGTPSVDPVTEIKFPNGSVTDNGGGSVSVSFTAGVGTVKKMTVTTINGDYLVCSDGTNSFDVAKWPENRTSLLSETIDGVDIDYSYSSSNQRTADDGTNTQTEVLYRRYVTGDVIFAVLSENGTGVTGVDWVEMSPRVWLRKYVQP